MTTVVNIKNKLMNYEIKKKEDKLNER